MKEHEELEESSFVYIRQADKYTSTSKLTHTDREGGRDK